MFTLDIVNESLGRWRAAGHSTGRREVDFLESIKARLESGKRLTDGQTSWLSPLISAVPPLRHEELELLESLEQVKDNGSINRGTRATAASLVDRLRTGSLSHAQARLARSIVADADSGWRPSDDEMEVLCLAVQLAKGRSNTWWSHRPGAWTCYERARSSLLLGENPRLSDFQALKSTFDALIREWRDPKFLEGQIVAAAGPYRSLGPGLIAGRPCAHRGGLAYPVYFASAVECYDIPSKWVRKRIS